MRLDNVDLQLSLFFKTLTRETALVATDRGWRRNESDDIPSVSQLALGIADIEGVIDC